MGSLIWTVVIGFAVGLVARALKPGKDSLGILMTSLLGIAGAFTATYIGRAFGWTAETGLSRFVAAVLGAVLLLSVFGLLKKK